LLTRKGELNADIADLHSPTEFSDSSDSEDTKMTEQGLDEEMGALQESI
jgi:hypothetical protein